MPEGYAHSYSADYKIKSVKNALSILCKAVEGLKSNPVKMIKNNLDVDSSILRVYAVKTYIIMVAV